MTKKDYIAIAKILNEKLLDEKQSIKASNAIIRVTYALAYYFEEDNASFNRDKFEDAIFS